jgi:glycosyltransferase involved in cell wall biosynthesis
MRELALAQAASGRYGVVGVGVIAPAVWPDCYATELARIGLPSYRCNTLNLFGTAQFLWQRLQPPPVEEWVGDLMKLSGVSQTIVHFHNAWMSGVFLPLRPVAQKVVTVVATMHGMPVNFARKPLRHLLHRWMASRLIRYCARLTSVDRPGTLQAERLLGIPHELFTVIPNGVADDPTLHANDWTGQGVFSFGYLGNLDENKGWQIGAQAAIALTARGTKIRYVIAGGGPQSEKAQTWQQRYPGVIEYLGHVSRPRENLLPKLHALSLMSSNEGLPMCMIEALSIGLPVIATRVGGIPEAITDDVNGLLVARDSISLAKALLRLHDHPPIHARLGSEGRRHFLKHFELSNALQNYHNLYLQSLQELRSPPMRDIYGSKQYPAALCD